MWEVSWYYVAVGPSLLCPPCIHLMSQVQIATPSGNVPQVSELRVPPFTVITAVVFSGVYFRGVPLYACSKPKEIWFVICLYTYHRSSHYRWDHLSAEQFQALPSFNTGSCEHFVSSECTCSTVDPHLSRPQLSGILGYPALISVHCI